MVDTESIVDSNELAIPLESSGSELIVVNEIYEEESITSPGPVTNVKLVLFFCFCGCFLVIKNTPLFL